MKMISWKRSVDGRGKTSFAEKHVYYVLLGSRTMMYPDVVAGVNHPPPS